MKRTIGRNLTVFSIAVMALGLLLWARLLLVTGYPRTAVAEPPERPATTAQKPAPMPLTQAQ